MMFVTAAEFNSYTYSIGGVGNDAETHARHVAFHGERYIVVGSADGCSCSADKGLVFGGGLQVVLVINQVGTFVGNSRIEANKGVSARCEP